MTLNKRLRIYCALVVLIKAPYVRRRRAYIISALSVVVSLNDRAIMAQIQIVLTQESTQSSVRVEISLAGGQEAIVSDETREAAVRATGAACISSISSLAQQNPNSVYVRTLKNC